MNLICVSVICALTETYGNYMFNIYEFPEWAELADRSLDKLAPMVQNCTGKP